MIEESITICGFPESGKTTYLAALWHLVTARVEDTALKFDSLRDGSSAHLNALATRWREGLTQRRTEIPTQKLVSMNLRDRSNGALRLTFPDLSGESYKMMFEDRECAPMVAEILGRGKGIVFFVHADKIRQPHLVVDMMAQSVALGSPLTPGPEVKWSPSLAPTQIRIVEFFQLLRLPPLRVESSRIAIVLSAWDKVADEGLAPEEFLGQRLPLLDQYLRSGADQWIWRVFGVSAQGGDYEEGTKTLSESQSAKLQALRALDEPSKRIRVVSAGPETRDLTEPVAWLMG